MKIPNYVEVISTQFPNVAVSAIGDSMIYENLAADSAGAALPSQADLDIARISHIRAEMWKLIQVEREARSQGGGYKVGVNWYHSDQISRTQQLAMVILGANLPAGVMWKTMSGSFVAMTPLLASQIFQTAVGSDQAIFGLAEQHRGAMMASATPETYNFSTGWPQSYQESIAV